jgi:hypothetical protein
MNIIISNFIFLGIISYLGYSLLNKRTKNNYYNLCIYICAVFLSSLINYNGTSSKKSLLLFLIYIIYIFALSKDTMKKRLLTVLSFFIIALLSEIIIGLILNYFNIINSMTSTSSIEYTYSLILSEFIICIFSFICKNY